MKRLLTIVLMSYLLYFSVGTIIDYSIMLGDVTSGTSPIEIEKPNDMHEDDFLSLIESFSKQSQIDILHKATRVVDGSYHTMYYITQHDPDFLQSLSSEKRNQLRTNGILEVNTLFGRLSYHPFEEMPAKSLERSQYYVANEHKEAWLAYLTSENITTANINFGDMTTTFINIRTQVYPMLIIAVAMLFFMLSRRGEAAVKRLHGYAGHTIIKDFLLSFVKALSMLTALCLLLGVTVHTVLFPHEWKDFLLYFSHRLLSVFGVLVGLFVVISGLNYLPATYLDLKGRIQSKPLFVTTFTFKSIVALMTMLYLTTALGDVVFLYRMHETQTFLSNRLQHYMQVEVNVSSIYMSDEDYRNNAHNELRFYQLTKHAFDGVIIASGNYAGTSLEETPAERFGEKSITINENYLDINPIYHVDGTEISKADLQRAPDLFHLLIPKSMEWEVSAIKQRYIERFEDREDFTEASIAVILYDDAKSSIYSYNSFVQTQKNGEIPSPIIEVFHDTYFADQFGNYFTGAYFLKIDAPDAYAELLPYLEETNLDRIVPYLNTVLDDFADHFRITQSNLMLKLVHLVINITGLIALVLYLALVYCANNRKRIAVMRMHGFSFGEIYKSYLIVQLGINLMLLLVLSFLVTANLWLFLLFAGLETLLFSMQAKRSEHNQILEVMKEGV